MGEMISHRETAGVGLEGGAGSVLRSILTRSRQRLRREQGGDERCGEIVEFSALDGVAPNESAWTEWADHLHPADAALMRHSLEYADEHGDDAPLSYV